MVNTEPTVAEWVAAGGQVAGAIATFVAVVVALWVAHRDWRIRRAEEFSRALAQARLVQSGNPGTVEPKSEGNNHKLRFFLANYSERPLLHVHFEAWKQTPTGAPDIQVTEFAWLPSRKEFIDAGYGDGRPQIAAWRIRWTDADGRHWYIDKHFADPEPYVGRPPRLYGP